MTPDPQPVAVLRGKLADALVRSHPSATLLDMPTEKLTHYAHEIAFGGDARDGCAAAQAPDLHAEGWVARAPDEHGQARARRHYLVTEVDLDAVSGWFPALLGMAARLRSHLAPDEQADVTMLLIAQPGAKATGRVSVLERNEAFAQVLIWTPGAEAQKWPSEADRFVARLRLGPIDGPSEATGRDLSPVDAVFDGTSVSAEVRSNWQGILMNTAINHVERARLLLAAVDTPMGDTHGE